MARYVVGLPGLPDCRSELADDGGSDADERPEERGRHEVTLVWVADNVGRRSASSTPLPLSVP